MWYFDRFSFYWNRIFLDLCWQEVKGDISEIGHFFMQKINTYMNIKWVRGHTENKQAVYVNSDVMDSIYEKYMTEFSF